jgi:hypothetical protein
MTKECFQGVFLLNDFISTGLLIGFLIGIFELLSVCFLQVFANMKRHSTHCPCNEHVKVQSEYFGEFIRKLMKASPKEQRKLLEKSSPCFAQFMCNCAKGILNGDIKISKKRLKHLAPDKKVLIKLVRPRVSLQKKKEFFLKEQKGGFIGVLAGIVASALASLLGSQLSKVL